MAAPLARAGSATSSQNQLTSVLPETTQTDEPPIIEEECHQIDQNLRSFELSCSGRNSEASSKHELATLEQKKRNSTHRSDKQSEIIEQKEEMEETGPSQMILSDFDAAIRSSHNIDQPPLDEENETARQRNDQTKLTEQVKTPKNVNEEVEKISGRHHAANDSGKA